MATKRRLSPYLHGNFTNLQESKQYTKGKYLLDVVKIIDAKMLYPIHTEHPDAYSKITDKMTIVKEGKKYELK